MLAILIEYFQVEIYIASHTVHLIVTFQHVGEQLVIQHGRCQEESTEETRHI